MFFGEERNKKPLSPTQFEAELDELVRWVEESVSPFEDDTPEKKEERVRRAEFDQEYFNRTYLPHYFTDDSAPFHSEMVEVAEEGERQQRPVDFAAPRGHAKSTHMSFARPLQKILYKKKKFIIVIGQDVTLAAGNTVSMRVELEHNQRILHDFGEQKTGTWAAGDFVSAGGTRAMARGIGQGIRGRKHGPYRPDLIIIDDPEDDEMVRNPDRVKQLVGWVNDAVIPSMDPKTGQLYWVGTLLSRKSALAKIMENPEWISKVYQAVADPTWSERAVFDPASNRWLGMFVSGAPLWASRFALDVLSRIRRRIGSLSFNKEYQNDPTDEDAKFKHEWIQRIAVERVPPCAFFQAIDPSIGQGEENDYNPNVTVGKSSDGKFYLRHADVKRRSIDAMVKTAYFLHSRFRALQVGLETNGFQKVLKGNFDNEARAQRKFLPIVPIEHYGVAKASRIQRLSPFVEQGVMLFAYGPETEVGDMETLIEQFEQFPSSRVHDDAPDATEMATWLAEGMAGITIDFQATETRRDYASRQMNTYVRGSMANY